MRTLTDHIVSGDQAVQLKVIVSDEPGAGGANHAYAICWPSQVDTGGASAAPDEACYITEETMFNYPVTEIYDAAGGKRCVFSAEEYALMLAEGWFDVKPEIVAEVTLAEAIEHLAPEPPKHRKGRK